MLEAESVVDVLRGTAAKVRIVIPYAGGRAGIAAEAWCSPYHTPARMPLQSQSHRRNRTVATGQWHRAEECAGRLTEKLGAEEKPSVPRLVARSADCVPVRKHHAVAGADDGLRIQSDRRDRYAVRSSCSSC